jgi:hypothetical protein
VGGVKRVQLHIDSLVVRGVPGLSRAALQHEVVAELQRVLAAPGAIERLTAAGPQARLRGAVQLTQAGGNAGAVASSISKALARGERR